MLNMYTSSKFVPNGMEIIRGNDSYFIAFNSILFDDIITHRVLEEVEHGKYFTDRLFKSQFGGDVDSIYLSTGTKTILNVKRYTDKCFYAIECGWNAEQFLMDYIDGNILITKHFLGKLRNNRSYSINGVLIKTESEFQGVLYNAENN